ncbi:MAG: hypothetical protein KJ622_09065 [Alphaproteobacteria bacterium]|nr:hypothetical protein [Alphaproteobacteria bacterium]
MQEVRHDWWRGLRGTWAWVDRPMSWSFLDQLTASGVSFCLGIAAARFAGHTEFGVFTLVLVLALLAATLIETVLALPMMTLAGARARRPPVYYSTVAVWTVITALAGGLTVSGIIGGFFYLRDGLIHGELVGVAFAVTFAQAAHNMVRRILFARLKGAWGFLCGVIRGLTIAVGGSALVVGGYTINAFSLLSLLAVASAVSVVIPLLRLLSRYPDVRMRRAVLNRHWKMSQWLVGMVSISIGQEQAIWLLLGGLLGDAAVGGARAGQHLLGITHFILLGMHNFVAREAAGAYAAGGHAALTRYLFERTWHLGLLTGALLLGLAVPAEFWLGLLLGDEYVRYADVLRLFAISYAAVFVREVWMMYLRTVDRSRGIFNAFALSSILAILAAAPAMLFAGIYGAVLVVISANVISLAYVLFEVRRSQREASAICGTRADLASEPR